MDRIFRTVKLAIALVAVVATSLTGAATAQAAADTRGPVLHVPAVSSFVVGQEIDDPIDLYGDGDLYFMDSGASRQFKWTATDPSGICRYVIDELHGVEGWSDGVENYRTHATTGQYVYHASDLPHSDATIRVRINAFDCAGNVTTAERSINTIGVLQDYGATIPSGWGRTSCLCAVGDSMLRTSTRYTSLSTVVSGSGAHVGLIVAKGPARGKAAIYYDGRYVLTIDTYASVNTNRVLVWDKEITGSGTSHTIKVVNLATSGRPRIDIDAYVI